MALNNKLFFWKPQHQICLQTAGLISTFSIILISTVRSLGCNYFDKFHQLYFSASLLPTLLPQLCIQDLKIMAACSSNPAFQSWINSTAILWHGKLSQGIEYSSSTGRNFKNQRTHGFSLWHCRSSACAQCSQSETFIKKIYLRPWGSRIRIVIYWACNPFYEASSTCLNLI